MKLPKILISLAVGALLISPLSSCSLGNDSALDTIEDFKAQNVSWEKCDAELNLETSRQSELFSSTETVDCASVLDKYKLTASSSDKYVEAANILVKNIVDALD